MTETKIHSTLHKSNPKPISQFWNLVANGPQGNATNLAIDQLLLEKVSKSTTSNTYLRFYSWTKPTLSIGYSQNAREVVDFHFCQQKKISVVRRPTGGRAVLHQHEITYSVISNDRHFFPIQTINGTYQQIAFALQCGLKQLGINVKLASLPKNKRMKHRTQRAACFASSQNHEILYGEKKLIGSAQRRTDHAFLQHGSILIDFNFHDLQGVLKEPLPSDLPEMISTLKSCLKHRPKKSNVISNLQKGFCETFKIQLKKVTLSKEFQNRAEILRANTSIKLH
ncbi:MAG: lipoate--protein ligase family protein [Acidobacteriia bacterium]|nr:lipoate--protein ligase family protein [Terriglobia bacterium]